MSEKSIDRYYVLVTLVYFLHQIYIIPYLTSFSFKYSHSNQTLFCFSAVSVDSVFVGLPYFNGISSIFTIHMLPQFIQHWIVYNHNECDIEWRRGSSQSWILTCLIIGYRVTRWELGENNISIHQKGAF